MGRSATSWRDPVSATSAAVFRIAFGLVGLILVVRFFAHGWIEELYLTPEYHFSYPGFEWVRPWPGPWMYVHFAALGAAALGVAVGYRYRVSAAVFTLLFTYVELIDRSLYLNHYYWLALTGALMVFLPLQRRWSLDSRSGRVDESFIPVGVLWLLRFQVGMVYFFAGLAKLNPDWLLDGQPLATWLPARADMPLVGALLATEPTAIVLSWGAALFDLTIVGWLSWKRTRPYAYAVVVVFHTMTWLLFPTIGLFPVLMSAGALIFFAPDWPEALTRRLVSRSGLPPRPLPAPPPTVHNEGGGFRPSRTGIHRAAVLASVYIAVMVVLPLRHLTIPGDVHTTGGGYLGSWHVMLTEKVGSVRFTVTDPATGESWQVAAPDFLTDRQETILATDPVMVQQTARLVSQANGGMPVEAEVWLTVNGRISTPLLVFDPGNTQ